RAPRSIASQAADVARRTAGGRRADLPAEPRAGRQTLEAILTTKYRVPNVNVPYIHMRIAMSGAANNGAYGNPGMGHRPWNSPWGEGPAWNQPTWGHPGWDHWHSHWRSLPKTLRIIAIVLGFMLWWPV